MVDCVTLPLHTSYRVQYGLPFSFELVDLSIILQMSSFDSQLLTNLHAIEKFSTLIISQRFKAWYMTAQLSHSKQANKVRRTWNGKVQNVKYPLLSPWPTSTQRQSPQNLIRHFRHYKSMGDRSSMLRGANVTWQRSSTSIGEVKGIVGPTMPQRNHQFVNARGSATYSLLDSVLLKRTAWI